MCLVLLLSLVLCYLGRPFHLVLYDVNVNLSIYDRRQRYDVKMAIRLGQML